MKATKAPAIVRVGVQILVREQGNLLLVQRNRGFGAGLWGLPGGHLEPRETIFECALRELLEETGVTGQDPKIVAVTDPHAQSNHHMQIAVGFSSWSGEPHVVDPDECQAVRFFSFNDLPHELFPSSEQVLAKVRQGVIY